MSDLVNNSPEYSNLNKDIGERIKTLRTLWKLTQKELALGVDSSPQYIQKIETGSINISVIMAQNAARFFNVDIRFILFGESELLHSECEAPSISFEQISGLSRLGNGEVLDSFNNLIMEIVNRYPQQTAVN